MTKYKVDGNLPPMIIEADNEAEAIEEYLTETKNLPIKVEVVQDD